MRMAADIAGIIARNILTIIYPLIRIGTILLGDRLAAGRRVLAPLTEVRILVPQPF